MGLFPRSQHGFVRAVVELNYTNPFLQQRIEWERAALGRAFVDPSEAYWSRDPGQNLRRSNLIVLQRQSESIAVEARARLLKDCRVGDGELEQYDDLVLYMLFNDLLDDWATRSLPSDAASIDQRAWRRYSERFDYFLKLPNYHLPSLEQKVHLFAIFRQIYRAFFNIFDCVIGQSLPAARLRARIWQSIFTHDLRRYRRSLYRTLDQVTTLVTGPSGSGKELVAKAIGTSPYVPFDAASTSFVANPDDQYVAINISAFSSTLIESELFGHAKGAFTDASSARAGWLESCGPYGCLLLDEIGELDATTQVKLLRVLQNRQYQRLGESKVRSFQGKIVAATNRDLQQEIGQGRFREDLYYRLCADVIETPCLAEQLRDNPQVLENLVAYIAQRIAPDEHASITAEVVDWIRGNVPLDYRWPGNTHDREQHGRNHLLNTQ